MKYMSPIQLRQFLSKALPGRVMGVNVGTEFLGVAMGDLTKREDKPELDRIPLNDKSGEPRNVAVIASEIKQMVDRNNVKGMIFGRVDWGLDVGQPDGHPLSSDIQEVKKFVQKLEKTNIITDMNYSYDKFADMDVDFEGHGEQGAVEERGKK